MESLQDYMDEYNKQVAKGYIPKAYGGLMEYMKSLRVYFESSYPEYSAPGGLYQGYMDMTYFPLFPHSLQRRNLKIAVVYIHESARFEVWLAGANRKVQAEYRRLIGESGWNKFRSSPAIKGTDSIIEYTLVEQPDFGDSDALTGQIAAGTSYFITEIENFLSGH